MVNAHGLDQRAHRETRLQDAESTRQGGDAVKSGGKQSTTGQHSASAKVRGKDRPRAADKPGSRREPGRRLVLAAMIALAAFIGAGLVAAWLLLRDDGSSSSADGPPPIAQLDTPDVHSLLIDLNDPDHILFGSHAGTMESRDGGFAWAEATMQGKDAMSMARSPNNPSTIYVTGHDVVEVSHDSGATWQPLEHDLPGTDVHAFAQDPVDPDVLYAFVVGSGVLRSENGGANWAPLENQPPGGNPYSLAATGGQVYAATAAGVRVSADRGGSWRPLPSQPGGTPFTLAMSALDSRVLYAGTESGLMRSIDGGESWTALGPPGNAVFALAVAPSDPQRVVFVAQGGGVYRSDDGGTTWRAPRQLRSTAG